MSAGVGRISTARRDTFCRCYDVGWAGTGASRMIVSFGYGGPCHETRTSRGRLIDHVQLVVDDLPAARRFYEAFSVLDIPIGGSAETHFWVDELFISSGRS